VCVFQESDRTVFFSPPYLIELCRSLLRLSCSDFYFFSSSPAATSFFLSVAEPSFRGISLPSHAFTIWLTAIRLRTAYPRCAFLPRFLFHCPRYADFLSEFARPCKFDRAKASFFNSSFSLFPRLLLCPVTSLTARLYLSFSRRP